MINPAFMPQDRHDRIIQWGMERRDFKELARQMKMTESALEDYFNKAASKREKAQRNAMLKGVTSWEF